MRWSDEVMERRSELIAINMFLFFLGYSKDSNLLKELYYKIT